jgi:hypothetical protein
MAMLIRSRAWEGVPPIDPTTTTGKMKAMETREMCWSPSRIRAVMPGCSSTPKIRLDGF